MAKDAAKVAADWAQKLAASTQKIKDGVMSVSESPTAKAARNPQGYLSGVQQAVADGSWQAGLQRVSLADWQQAMLNKGVNRVGTGATAAQPKFAQFMAKLLPFQEAAKRNLDSAMPRGDFSANQQRMLAWSNAMHEFKK